MAFDVFEHIDGHTHFVVQNGSKELALAWLMAADYTDRFRVCDTDTGKVVTADEWIDSLKVSPVGPKPEFTPKFYRMNPDEDEIFLSGNALRNGMKVLIAQDSMRVRTEEPMDDWELERALKNNRWCTITKLEIDSASVQFVGVYDDETKAVRKVARTYSWFVKKSTIAPTPKEQQVYELIKAAMERAVQLCPDEIDDLAMQTAEKISELP